MARGPLCGGNLSLLAASMGTPWEIDTRGKILFLEDVNEKSYRVDSMLTQLRNGGKFDDCAGIILGHWTDCEPEDESCALTLEEIFEQLIVPAGKPAICGFACGHSMPTHALPLGRVCELDAARARCASGRRRQWTTLLCRQNSRPSSTPFPRKAPCTLSILTTGEVIASLRAETRVVSASTIKVALLFCALEDVMAGKLALDMHISIAPEDFREDTRVFEPEYRQDGCSLWEMLYWMIVLSDNTATNAIISTLGCDHINAYCARLGLENTACQRKMLDWTAVREGRNNYTSALDQFRLYEMLYRGEILSEELRAVAADFLSRVRSFDELQRYIPTR